MPAFLGRKATAYRLYSIPNQPPNTYIAPAPEFDVSAYSTLIAFGQVGPGATLAADVNPYVQPIDAQGNWAGIALPAIRAYGNLVNGYANKITEYDVLGLQRVRLNIANLNATLTLPLIFDVFLQ